MENRCHFLTPNPIQFGELDMPTLLAKSIPKEETLIEHTKNCLEVYRMSLKILISLSIYSTQLHFMILEKQQLVFKNNSKTDPNGNIVMKFCLLDL